jgi:hypothetical protein
MILRDPRPPEPRPTGAKFIFFLTFLSKNLIYGSHCDLNDRKFDVRENQSMKNATKKAAKKATKKSPAKKSGKK